MDIVLQNEEYCCLKKCFDTTVEECVEAELSLPEYMPEILRIIKSTAVPKINSVNTVGERVTVDGSCELRMIYVGEDNCIYSFSQTRAFTRYCENQAFLNAEDVRVSLALNFVNSRATNTKRAEIKAGVGILVSAFCKEVEKIACLNNISNIEEKKLNITSMSLGCKKSKAFSMSDTISVENGTAAFLIRANACAVLGEVRKISNKIMLKGDAIIEIAFVTNEDKSTISHIRRSLPINQILEFDGMDERFTGDVALDVIALDVIIKNDSSGEGKTMDVALSINASITMWEQKELTPIIDAYALDGAIDLNYKKMKFYSALDAIRDTYIYKNNVEISNGDIDCILDAFCECGDKKLCYNEGTVSVSGTLKAIFILKDSKGSIITNEKMLDYSFERSLECNEKLSECVPNVSISSFEYLLKGKDSIDVKAELQVNCSIFSETELDVITC